MSVCALYWQNLTFSHLAKEKKCKGPGFIFTEKANMINLELRVNKLITGTESLVWLLQVRKLRLQRRETAQPELAFALLLFRGQVVSDSLRPQGLYPTRLLCSPLSPRVSSNSYPLSGWCCLTISSSATPFSFCLQTFPVLGSFPMSWLFASGGQSIGAPTSATVLAMNIALFYKVIKKQIAKLSTLYHCGDKSTGLKRAQTYSPAGRNVYWTPVVSSRMQGLQGVLLYILRLTVENCCL